MNNKQMKKYLNMLSFCRPEGSKAQEIFCSRYIEPLMGKPDSDGNYLKVIGDSRIIFTSHHDTVHKKSGNQQIYVHRGIAFSQGRYANCLGADCTTGVFIMLEMIKAKVPGVYVIHAAEECGGLGSDRFVNNSPIDFSEYDFVISFDRYGTDSIITHQMGTRTASDTFAESLSDVLGMSHKPDRTGSFTDSDNYQYVVPECTNLSVGYYNQHTDKEYQDLPYLSELLEKLIKADWSLLKVGKDVNDYRNFTSGMPGQYNYERNTKMGKLVSQYPDEVADILKLMGVSYEDLRYDLEGY